MIKVDAIIMVSMKETTNQRGSIHKYADIFDADLEEVFRYVAACQERSNFDCAVNNHFNDDENPTVFTVILLK